MRFAFSKSILKRLGDELLLFLFEFGQNINHPFL